MALQIEVGSVGKAVEFACPKGEIIDEIDGALGVVGELLFGMLFLVDAGRIETDELAPLVHGGQPICKSFFPSGFPDEIFDLHLLEFDDAEDEIARRDLVAERFSDLGDAEGDFDPHRVDDVFIIEEDRLSGLRAKVGDIPIGAGFAHVGMEHQVEVPRFSKVLSAAFGAFHFLLLDQVGHLRERQPVGVLMQGLLDQVVAAEPSFAILAVDEGVVEPFQMSGGRPGFRMQEDRAVQSHHVAPFLDKGRPPEIFNIFFEFGSIGAERVGIGESAVDFRTRIDEPAPLAKGDDRFKGFLDRVFRL